MPQKRTGKQGVFNLQELQNVIDVFQRSEISELEIEQSGMRVRLRKRGGQAFSHESIPQSSHRGLIKGHTDRFGTETDFVTITSPIVGTFYRAPQQDAAPFVEEGDQIKKGQVLGVIEAMKLMNEIESDIEGTVVTILVENGTAVEYGEPLFLLKPKEKQEP